MINYEATYYKAVNLDGTDFWTGTVAWANERPVNQDRVVRHPTSAEAILRDYATSLTVSTTPWVLPGAPADHRQIRLLTVVPTDWSILKPSRCKRQSVAWLVTGEIESWHRYGPMGEHVASLFERTVGTSVDGFLAGFTNSNAPWNAPWNAAWHAAMFTNRGAAWNAVWDVVRFTNWVAAYNVTINIITDVVRNAACALAVRDLIGRYGYTQEHYDTLTLPLRLAGITVHPDDSEVRK